MLVETFSDKKGDNLSEKTDILGQTYLNLEKKQSKYQKPTFQAQLHAAIDRAKCNVSSLMYILELAKYRLNKKIPRTLPFEERKLALINREEWNG